MADSEDELDDYDWGTIANKEGRADEDQRIRRIPFFSCRPYVQTGDFFGVRGVAGVWLCRGAIWRRGIHDSRRCGFSGCSLVVRGPFFCKDVCCFSRQCSGVGKTRLFLRRTGLQPGNG
jgi:hypothetical protein